MWTGRTPHLTVHCLQPLVQLHGQVQALLQALLHLGAAPLLHVLQEAHHASCLIDLRMDLTSIDHPARAQGDSRLSSGHAKVDSRVAAELSCLLCWRIWPPVWLAAPTERDLATTGAASKVAKDAQHWQQC